MHDRALDLAIVRDLPLIHVGLHLRRRYGIPIVLDMAENYPAMYREAVRDGGSLVGAARWFLKNPAIMARVERAVLPQLDHVLVVVEESAQRVLALGVDPRRVTVVGNTPRVPTDQAPAARAVLDGRPLQLIYTGFVQDGRGLETVIRGLQRLRERGQRVRFTVVGDGDFRGRLQALVSEAGIQDQVHFTGWVPHERLAAHIAEADVGVIPHPKNDHTDTTIPNKLFDYMLQGLPVLVSDAAPLQRIVTTERCGEVFQARDEVSLAEALSRLMHSSELADMGRRGAAAVQRRYRWDVDAAELCRAISCVLRQRTAAAAV
jgi:glycosyltransferase involved in cell wall biosynthesis